MTDLERLWDDLPVGPAPTDRIVRRGRAESRGARRRVLLRPVGSLVVLGSLAAGFLAAAHVAGPPPLGPGGPGGASGGATIAEPAAFHGELVAAGSCAALLEHYVEQAEGLVGAGGWVHPSPAFDGWAPVRDAVVFGAAPVPTSARAQLGGSSPTTSRATSSETGTNVQEAGVDEPDVVKTDGETLYRLDEETLEAYDVTGPEVELLGKIRLEGTGSSGLLLAGDTVVVIEGVGEHEGDADPGDTGSHGVTRVYGVDVADPAAMTVSTRLDLDAGTVAVRQHGGTVRLVLSTGLPDLDFVHPGRDGGMSNREALRRNRELVRATTIGDWLPSGAVDRGPDQQLSDCADVAVPRDDLDLGTTTVLGFPAGDPAAWDVTAVAARATTTYASTRHLYLASAPPVAWGWGACRERCPWVVPDRDGADPASGRTHVFDFELTETGTRYVGAGEVEGAVQDRWAIDESDDVLRLAVSPTHTTGDFNSVVTLRREGGALAEVGRLDRLGVGETIQSVRWFDDLAIVVTFRQVDPLYTVDLTDPARPALLGKLKVPGFSEYLHPLGPHRIIGLGQGPSSAGRGWGAQAGLFRVTDLTDPRRLSVVDYPTATQARAGADPRQFTWLPGRRTALTVLTHGGRATAGWVSVLTVANSTLSNRMVEVEPSSDVASVRLVPLPDERVVLITDDVEYLALE